jgi:hypothetical protein
VAGHPGAFASAYRLVERDLWPLEWEALIALARRLSAGDGDLFEPTKRPKPEELLLRHALAVVLEPDYVRELALWRTLGSLTEGPRVADIFRRVRRILIPSRHRLDADYGGPHGTLGYALLRLRRPFDLLRRAVTIVSARSRS